MGVRTRRGDTHVRRSQRWVHLRCLRAWQRVSLLNGSTDKAARRAAPAQRGAAGSTPTR
jgi:hypothetical protein